MTWFALSLREKGAVRKAERPNWYLTLTQLLSEKRTPEFSRSLWRPRRDKWHVCGCVCCSILVRSPKPVPVMSADATHPLGPAKAYVQRDKGPEVSKLGEGGAMWVVGVGSGLMTLLRLHPEWWWDAERNLPALGRSDEKWQLHSDQQSSQNLLIGETRSCRSLTSDAQSFVVSTQVNHYLIIIIIAK